MSAAEFIDKVLTPLAAGLGALLAIRFSTQLRSQFKPGVEYVIGAAVAVAVGAYKWWF